MLNTRERVESYNRMFPDYPPLIYYKNKKTSREWIYGVWIIGNDYRNPTSYYGAYPRSYLKRILSLFPDIVEDQMIHLFSGSIDPSLTNALCIDINPMFENTYPYDAEKLSQYIREKKTLILADPDYSEEDARKRGMPLINRNRVIKECYKILELNGFIVWLDQVKPMYRKDKLHMLGTIGVDRSTNHRVRFTYIFQKISKELWE